MNAIVRVLVLNAALLVGGCGGDGGPSTSVVTSDQVARVDVSPGTLTLAVGGTGQLSALAISTTGAALPGRAVTWSSSDAAVASVSSTGLVTGLAAGTSTIVALSEGRTGSATVTVTSLPVATVRVVPASVTLGAGSTTPLQVVALGPAGETLAGRTASWASSNTAIATVTPAGVVTGVAAGATTVRATVEGVSGDATVTVQSPTATSVARVVLTPAALQLVIGSSAGLAATAQDSAGVTLQGKSFTYTSSAPSVATVSGAGLVTALATGTAVITAASEGKQASATVTVTGAPGPVARLVLSPPALSIVAGRQDQLTPVAYDSAGIPVTGLTYGFTSSATSVATVSATGLVAGVAPGNATITVSAAGKTATSTVVVNAASGGTITRVDVTPPSATLAVNATVQLTGAAYDAQGRVSTAESHIWSTSNANIATVTTNGLVTGLAPGTANITMSAAGFVKSVPITVTGAVTNRIDLNPAVTYQRITGWQALTQNGWLDCNPTAFAAYKNQLHDRAVNELGINRMTLMLRSGAENTRDYHADFVAGTISDTANRLSWYQPVNDNTDPFTAVASRFHWGFVDGQVDNAILPMQQRLAARGEKLYVVLQVVDFKSSDHGNLARPFDVMTNAEEYAELVAEAFKHLRQKYNLVPDALEMILEPEHTPYSGSIIGRAVVASVNRLRGLGFTPAIIAPSTTSMQNASTWYDQMMQTPGIRGMVTELAYHRYVAVSFPNLQAIGLRTLRDGVASSMLEHIGSGFNDLYDDLTVGMVSSWQQFTLGFCGNRNNSANQGAYFQINQSNPAQPNINITDHSKLLRQVFAYVRSAATRIGAVSANAAAMRPLAFRNADGRLVVVVATTGPATFAIRGLAAGTYGVNYGTSGAQYNVDLADVVATSGADVTIAMPAGGVVTVYAR
ncbi:MAG: Ig-like domain-containing protein [Gemmatimonadetes bacterium]|nr:Ig-like domain-containing protein [Gemmatimonadota bacterium]